MVDQESETVVRVEAQLASVEHALERLRHGTYRVCESCGEPLEPADLEADPVRTLCAAHLSL